jgi:hypothetical protein
LSRAATNTNQEETASQRIVKQKEVLLPNEYSEMLCCRINNNNIRGEDMLPGINHPGKHSPRMFYSNIMYSQLVFLPHPSLYRQVVFCPRYKSILPHRVLNLRLTRWETVAEGEANKEEENQQTFLKYANPDYLWLNSCHGLL